MDSECDNNEALLTLPDGRELYEHFRFVADAGQKMLRVDKFLVASTATPSSQAIASSRRMW